MRPIRWLNLFAGILVLTACEQDATVFTGPVVDELWLGPDVVATEPEMTALSDIAMDPFMVEVSAMVPATVDQDVGFVLENFSTGLADNPGPAFVTLEQSLTSLYGGPDVKLETDAQMAGEVLDLYRDYAAQTLFGMDREALAPFTQPNGS